MFDTTLDRRRFIGGSAVAGALAATPAWARQARTDAGHWDKVQALLDGYVANDRLPGAAAAVARTTDDADFLVAGTVGRGRPRAVDADTLYRVYSMTKPITAMAAMMLIEDAKLGLDQDIGDLIPGFKNPRVAIDPEKSLDSRPAAQPIRIRNLMTHTAGLGYQIVSKGALLAEINRQGLIAGVGSRLSLPGNPIIPPAPGLAAFADRYATLPLIADPGTKWSYSAGLDILGRIIELASGMAFDRFLQTRIFDPLGMTSTYFQVPKSELPRLTTNYGVLNGKQIPIDGVNDSVFADDPAILLGGAGLVMSPRDYDRFMRMLAGYGAVGRTRVMKTETAKLAMSNLLPPTAQYLENGIAQGFGAGGRVRIASDGFSGAGTYGWGGAAATVAFVDPVRGVRASGFAQYIPSDAMPFTREFAVSVYASIL